MSSHLNSILNAPVWLQAILALITFILINAIYSAWYAQRPVPGLPIIALTDKGWSSKKSYSKDCLALIRRGVEEHQGRTFQVISTTGPKIVLANPELVEEIKSHPDSRFLSTISQDFFAGWSGFEGFATWNDPRDLLLAEIIKKNLVSLSPQLIEDIVKESSASLEDDLGSDTKWKSILLGDVVSTAIARVSSRCLLGSKFSNDTTWISVAKSYAKDVFVAAYLLRMVPVLLRPVAHWILPTSYTARRSFRDAERSIKAEVAQRLENTQGYHDDHEGKIEGKLAIDWIDQTRKDHKVDLDHTKTMVTIILASVSTTSTTLSRALVDVSLRPDLIAALRQEAIDVIKKKGWTRATMNELHLLDSFLKESKRYHQEAFSMFRGFVKDVTLSDGTFVPAHTQVVVASRAGNPKCFPEPDTFDAYRFYNLRPRNLEKGNNVAFNQQFVSTSPDLLTFGYGKFACPGRFFAAAQIKTILVSILLKYDFRLETKPEDVDMTFEQQRNLVKPEVKMQFKRRKEEVELGASALL